MAFDALGMVVGTAVMGKPRRKPGDWLDGFDADLTELVILDHGRTHSPSRWHARQGHHALVYDLFAYQRTKNQPNPQPAVVYTLARETHDADLAGGQQTRIQHSFSYSDGFGREIQKKIQAEPGPARSAIPAATLARIGRTAGNNTNDSARAGSATGGRYSTTKASRSASTSHFSPRPTALSLISRMASAPCSVYDPVERVVVTLHPNHTWEKVVFDPWRQTTWDVNDTVLIADPETDADIGGFYRRLPDADYLPTWHTQRQGGALDAQEQAAAQRRPSMPQHPPSPISTPSGAPS